MKSKKKQEEEKKPSLTNFKKKDECNIKTRLIKFVQKIKDLELKQKVINEILNSKNQENLEKMEKKGIEKIFSEINDEVEKSNEFFALFIISNILGFQINIQELTLILEKNKEDGQKIEDFLFCFLDSINDMKKEHINLWNSFLKNNENIIYSNYYEIFKKNHLIGLNNLLRLFFDPISRYEEYNMVWKKLKNNEKKIIFEGYMDIYLNKSLKDANNYLYFQLHSNLGKKFKKVGL